MKSYGPIYPLTCAYLDDSMMYAVSRWFYDVCSWCCDYVGGLLTLPHFTNTELVSHYGNQQTLHFTYYLKHVRPSFAVFAFTLANCRLDSRKLSHRFIRVYTHWHFCVILLGPFFNSSVNLIHCCVIWSRSSTI